MVALGGITRLTGSGLSITEWKPVTGALPPLTESAWQAEFAKYREIPQFKEMNSWMQLDDFKRIFFWEYLHRLFGRLIGVFFFLPFIYFVARKQVPRRWTLPLLGLFALGGLQGFLGWYMVQSGLSKLTSVSHYRLAVHLIAAFVIGAAMLWVRKAMQDADEPARLRARAYLPVLTRLVRATVALVVLQTFYGALTAGLKAGFQFPTFPTFNGQWIPDRMLELAPAARNFLDNPIAVQWIHRANGTLLVTLAMGTWFRYRTRLRPHRSQRVALTAFAHTILLQYGVGIGVVLFGVPVWLGTFHQVTGFAVFLLAAQAWFEFRKPL
jgi:cytochrome c oxidase assembly protein subunit 15